MASSASRRTARQPALWMTGSWLNATIVIDLFSRRRGGLVDECEMDSTTHIVPNFYTIAALGLRCAEAGARGRWTSAKPR